MPKLRLPETALRILGHQLGRPTGPVGAVIARALNRGNAPTIAAAVAALDLRGDEDVADLGFGGGLGLDLLLDATAGSVHGVDPSADMRARARRHHRRDVGCGRLLLHDAMLESLPFDDADLGGWICLNTVYFVPDLVPAAAELARVLRPTGTGVLGLADPVWLASLPFTPHGFEVRPVEEVVAALEAAGLVVRRRTVAGGPTTAGGHPFHLLVCRHRG